MKTMLHRCLASFPLMAAALSATSCIYDTPVGDRFFRTLWTSSEAPFENLTIEFLCGGNISAKADNAAGSYGSYQPSGETAWFTGLHLILDNSPASDAIADDSSQTEEQDRTETTREGLIIIEEAHRTNDILLISWHYSGSTVTHSTRLHRLSSYQ